MMAAVVVSKSWASDVATV